MHACELYQQPFSISSISETSYLANSSLRSRTSSWAVHWSERLVNPQMSANKMLKIQMNKYQNLEVSKSSNYFYAWQAKNLLFINRLILRPFDHFESAPLYISEFSFFSSMEVLYFLCELLFYIWDSQILPHSNLLSFGRETNIQVSSQRNFVHMCSRCERIFESNVGKCKGF